MDHGSEEDCVKCDKANPGSDFHRNSIARILTPIRGRGRGDEFIDCQRSRKAVTTILLSLFLHLSFPRLFCSMFGVSPPSPPQPFLNAARILSTPKLINMSCFFSASVYFWKNTVILEIKVLDTARSCLFQGNCISFVSLHFVLKCRKNTAVWPEERVFWRE